MKKATSKYLVILGVLTLVILGSQMLMQKTITSSKSDSRIINISGRQRMLSQKITKASLALRSSKSEIDFNSAKEELTIALALWTNAQKDLQYGSSEIDTEKMNASEALMLLYEEITPYFSKMSDAANLLIEANFIDMNDTVKATSLDHQVEIIKSNEAAFLKLMNKITFEYDKQASEKIETLSTVEFYLMGITFMLILLEAFFIFRPMYLDARSKDLALKELENLRNGENTYAASQITQANMQIRSLRKVASDLNTELNLMSKKLNEFRSKA